MKKLFALFMVVAMLTVAGAAMADDVGGHGTPVPSNPSGGSSAAKEETVSVPTVVSVTVSNVKVIAARVANVVTTAALTTPSRRQTVVQQTVTAIISTLKALVSSVPANVQVRTAQNVVIVTSSTFTGDTAKDLANASAILKQKSGSDTKRAIGVAPSFSPKESGLQPIDLPKFAEVFYGKKPGIDLGARGKVKGSFFASDATGGNEAVFLDSTGAQTEVIPGNGAGNANAEAGVVTAVVYVEAGEEYDPIITTEVTAAEEKAFEEDTGTATQATVEVEEVKYESVQANTTPTFSPVVAADVRKAVSDKYGKTVNQLPYKAASTTATWSATSEETSYMTTNNLVFVSSLPVLAGLSDDAVYVAEVTFDNTPTRDVVGAPKFYPKGVSATGAATSAKLYTYANGSATLVDATNAKNVIVNGNKAYLVFEVANGEVATADFEAAAASLTKPAIVVSNTSSSSGDNNGGNGGNGNQGDIDNEPLPVGGSSGGCSAGSAALAMAVLGAFIATRKK